MIKLKHWDYILSFDVNEQLMLKVQKMRKVKERARWYVQRRLVNVTRPDKWSHNKSNKKSGLFQISLQIFRNL